LPEYEEQKAIAVYHDRETTKLDNLIIKIQAAIDGLKKCRIALIIAAVTGKIDVRNHAANKEAA
jgi:type I restriction enzyme S subunit